MGAVLGGKASNYGVMSASALLFFNAKWLWYYLKCSPETYFVKTGFNEVLRTHVFVINFWFLKINGFVYILVYFIA